jgi:hypothetical protein
LRNGGSDCRCSTEDENRPAGIPGAVWIAHRISCSRWWCRSLGRHGSCRLAAW